MLVTARAEYACLAMLELAQRYGDPKPIRLADITDRHDIPQRFLVQILLQMKSAGLVATTRGASGGYQLARPPATITLAEIFGVLDRMEEPEERNKASSGFARSLQKVWKGLADTRTQYLNQFKLTDLILKNLETDYVI